MTFLLEHLLLACATAAIVYLGKSSLLVNDPDDEDEVKSKAISFGVVQLVINLFLDYISRKLVEAEGNAPPDGNWDQFEEQAQGPGTLNVGDILALALPLAASVTARTNKTGCWVIFGVIAFLLLRTPGPIGPNIIAGR